MYTLPGKQITPALRQKTVRRGDISIGVANVECPIKQCAVHMASSISERSSKSKAAHGAS